jgi:hypothetical protein
VPKASNKCPTEMAFRARGQVGVSPRRRGRTARRYLLIDPPLAVLKTDRARSASHFLATPQRLGRSGGAACVTRHLVQALALLVSGVAIDLPPPAVTVSSGAELPSKRSNQIVQVYNCDC